MSFRDVSIHLTNTLDKDTKQSQGIFFTPKEARDRVLELVRLYCDAPKTILEPSFGSGEFLEDLYEQYPTAKITGVEMNPDLFASSSRPNRHNVDFLTYTGKHDLIVGNPPYFVMKKTSDTEKCQTGRPNIFVQFLYRAITENLKANGILAFVLPTSFFNCSYYERMRQWLYDHTTLLAVERLDGRYIDTQQDTFVLVVRKSAPKREREFFFLFGGHVYITPLYRELMNMTQGSSTLSQLGFEVKTGEIVWNQEKDKLCDSGTLLIYSSNFSTGSLILDNVKPPKKQYIECEKAPNSGKAILINRGYGNSRYVLKPILVDLPAYYCENHVNVIRPVTEDAEARIEDVLKSLQHPRTSEFIHSFTGNGALSKTELECCVPIWLD